jgi:hypothetical protein
MIGLKIAATCLIIFAACIVLTGDDKESRHYYACAVIGISSLAIAMGGVIVAIWS